MNYIREFVCKQVPWTGCRYDTTRRLEELNMMLLGSGLKISHVHMPKTANLSSYMRTVAVFVSMTDPLKNELAAMELQRIGTFSNGTKFIVEMAKRRVMPMPPGKYDYHVDCDTKCQCHTCTAPELHSEPDVKSSESE